MTRKYLILILAICFIAISLLARKATAPIMSLFPIENYDQNLGHWIKPTGPNFDQRLLPHDSQAKRFADFLRYSYGDLSPWQPTLPPNLKTEITHQLVRFSNDNKTAAKIGYGANFRILSNTWHQRLERNTNLAQFDHLALNPDHRAIAVNNTQGRELPTHDVHFYDHNIAGQGYPFDNLQTALVWAGTPLYVLGESADHQFVFVQTPSFRAWLNSTDIAFVDDQFVTNWRNAATKKLVAITDTEIPIIDTENHIFRTSGFIGMVFPGEQHKKSWRIMLPVRDEQGQARVHFAELPSNAAISMPLIATPHQFTTMISKLIHRPYGWGGMYLYNDCASELKNLYTPFGFFLPINSTEQVDPKNANVKIVDLPNANREARIKFLMTEGKPFMTIINNGGHVILYLGTYPNPNDPHHRPVALSYQNVWAVEPRTPAPGKDRRSVIGGAVLLPILPYFPEDRGIASDADYERFTVAFLINENNT
ncbi:MAG: SH3 domain-containing protein [Pseudomonadota bacterium]|nr:SH3 domain-containing protein [Pseudomonadota bacterium]